MHQGDMKILFKTNTNLYRLCGFTLPLFELNVFMEDVLCLKPNDLILIVRNKNGYGELNLSFEQLEEINKTWNKFYER
jgi:hypothetical protein